MLLIAQSQPLVHRAPGTPARDLDAPALLERAQAQVAASADAFDISGAAGADVEDIAWFTGVLRDAFPELPLFVDAGDDVRVGQALEVCEREGAGAPIIGNSIAVNETGRFTEEGRAALHVAARSGAGIVISPRLLDTPDEVADHEYIAYAAMRAAELVRAEGVTGTLYLDALAFPAGSDPVRCARSLSTLAGWKLVDHAEPLTAVSNVGYGAEPALASALRAVYAAAAIGRGARALILPVEDAATMLGVNIALGRQVVSNPDEEWLLSVATSAERGVAPEAAPAAYAEAAALLFGA